MITQEKLQELVDYVDGKLIAKTNSKCRKVGDALSSLTDKGYLKSSVGGKSYRVHRLVFLYHHGYMPIQVDHIDGNPSNNKLENLRDVPHSVNIQNRKAATTKNKTGFLGVVKRKNKFAAHIHRNGKQVYLGLFATAEMAHQAYKENT